MEETLSPTWCELLLYDQVLMEGSKDEYREDPPVVIINIYDYNKLVSDTFQCIQMLWNSLICESPINAMQTILKKFVKQEHRFGFKNICLNQLNSYFVCSCLGSLFIFMNSLQNSLDVRLMNIYYTV